MVDELRACTLFRLLIRFDFRARLAQLIESHVARDVEDPRFAAAITSETRCVLEQSHEHFLHQVFAQRAAMRHVQAEAVNRAMMAFEERAEA